MYKFLFTIFIFTQLSYADCLNSTPVTNENIQKTLQCFQNEIFRLKKSSSIVNVNVIDGLPRPTIEKTATVNQFRYDLHECNRKHTTVICRMTITNTGRDVMATLHSGVAYDEKGKQFKTASTSIIDQVGTKARDFISNVPIEAHFTINNVPESSTQFSAIKLSTNFGKVIYKGIVIKP